MSVCTFILPAPLKSKGAWTSFEWERSHHFPCHVAALFSRWEHCSQVKRPKLLLILPFSIGLWYINTGQPVNFYELLGAGELLNGFTKYLA